METLSHVCDNIHSVPTVSSSCLPSWPSKVLLIVKTQLQRHPWGLVWFPSRELLASPLLKTHFFSSSDSCLCAPKGSCHLTITMFTTPRRCGPSIRAEWIKTPGKMKDYGKKKCSSSVFKSLEPRRRATEHTWAGPAAWSGPALTWLQEWERNHCTAHAHGCPHPAPVLVGLSHTHPTVHSLGLTGKVN